MKEIKNLLSSSVNICANEEIINKIIKLGRGVESQKVDFKSQLTLDTRKDKGDLLKDLTAIANSESDWFYNCGYLIIENFKYENIDKLKADIDQLMKEYISPIVEFFIIKFNNCGVFIIPPSFKIPHVFIKDFPDDKGEIYIKRGDIFVRRGSTTDRAMPEDFARFIGSHIKSVEKIFEYKLDSKIKELEQKFEINKIKITKSEPIKELSFLEEIEVFFSQNSLKRLKEKLKRIAFNLDKFLQSNEIKWDLEIIYKENEKEQYKEIIDKINNNAKELWQAVVKIALKCDDHSCDLLLEPINILAHEFKPLSGIPYTRKGIALRYYPLIVLLYILFIVGSFKKNDMLLRKIIQMDLKRESKWFLPDFLFLVQDACGIFDTQCPEYPKKRPCWCYPLGEYIKDFLFDGIIDLEDPYLIDQKDKYFYIGEFILSLFSLGVKKIRSYTAPVPGTYMYQLEACDIIKNFLKNEKDWLKKVYPKPIKDILETFESTVNKIINPYCIIGLHFTKCIKEII